MEKKVFVAEICHADVQNANGDVYPRQVLEAQIERLKESISNRACMGELGEPTNSFVSFANASHLVTALFMNGDKMMAKVEVINTPSGSTLKKLIDQGVPIEFKMSGVGAVEEKDGQRIVQDSYKLIQIYATQPEPKISISSSCDTFDKLFKKSWMKPNH